MSPKSKPSIINDFKGCTKPTTDVVEYRLGHIFSSDPTCWCCFCPSCHVINSHYDVLLTGSSPWQRPNGINGPFFEWLKRSNWLLRAISESSRPCALTSIACLALEMRIPLQIWPHKPCLQNFPICKLISKVPTTNIIMTWIEDSVNVLLRRNLPKYLVLPHAKKILTNESISHCLPCKLSSFSSCGMWRWFSCL